MQVIDLLFRQELNLRLHVIGDLARPIRWVHASDSRDPAPYLNGEEVVLSTGAWFTGKESVTRFVAGLMKANVAALGFGVHDDMPTVPMELIVEAKKNNLTLFEVPSGVTFISLSELFVDLSMAHHEQPLRENATRNAELLGILQRQDGIGAMLKILSTNIPGRKAIISGDNILASDQSTLLESAPVLLDLFANFARYPILAGSLQADLIIENFAEEPTLEQRQVIDQVLPFLAIELQRFQFDLEIARKFAEEIFDFIEASPRDDATIYSRMRSIGVKPESPMVALCIAIADVNSEAPLGVVNKWLHDQSEVGIAGIRKSELLVLLPATEKLDIALLGEEIHALLGGGNFLGVGTIVAAAKGAHESIIQARYAAHFAARSGGVGYSTYDALASHVVLLTAQSDQTLERFETVLLQPLIAHDANRHSDLVHTLQRFLALNGQFQVAADDLHIHVNTLRQRLNRIEELTGRDLSLMHNKVDFWLALEARKLRKPPAQ